MKVVIEPGQEKKLVHKEPPYAKEKLEMGEFGISYFRGQTFLFIPKSVGAALGMERLRAMADQIFGKEIMDEFAGSISDNYELSYFMELPPQSDRDNNQITEFIQAIKNEAKDCILNDKSI